MQFWGFWLEPKQNLFLCALLFVSAPLRSLGLGGVTVAATNFRRVAGLRAARGFPSRAGSAKSARPMASGAPMKKTSKLKNMLTRKELAFLMEAHNGLSAKVVQEAGFEALQHFVPGGAAHRPEKRWPADQYASLAAELADKHLIPVLIGSNAESDVMEIIANRVPTAINLCGKTTIAQLAVLARDAFMAVGNDTGPMHVIAASRCPSVVLFSKASSPKRSAPPGEHVHSLQRGNLSDLSVDEVLTVIHGLRPLDTNP